MKHKWWLTLGLFFFIGISIYSVIRSFGGNDFFMDVFNIIDWFAACVIYFFIGALIGFVIDKFKNKKTKYPLWFFLFVGLWIISIITLLIVADKSKISYLGIIFFPIIYGLFFTGMAFTILFPGAIVKTYYGKLIFDILFLAVFGFWLYYEKTNKKMLVRKIL